MQGDTKRVTDNSHNPETSGKLSRKPSDDFTYSQEAYRYAAEQAEHQERTSLVASNLKNLDLGIHGGDETAENIIRSAIEWIEKKKGKLIPEYNKRTKTNLGGTDYPVNPELAEAMATYVSYNGFLEKRKKYGEVDKKASRGLIKEIDNERKELKGIIEKEKEVRVGENNIRNVNDRLADVLALHEAYESVMGSMLEDEASTESFTDTPPDKGKGREQDAPGQLVDATEHAVITYDRFRSQSLHEIFPHMKEITDPAKKQANDFLMHQYAQELEQRAQKMSPNIFQNYEGEPIYYKWHGSRRGKISELVALRDLDNNMVYIGPSIPNLRLPKQSKHYKTLTIQQIYDHLTSKNNTVEWRTYDILRPLYKWAYKSGDKKGPVGLYFTDSYTQIVDAYGGDSRTIPKLYTSSNTVGPWQRPKGEIEEQPKKRTTGDIYSTKVIFE